MSEHNEPQVDVASLDASLGDLLKAADAQGLQEKLSKAYGGVSMEHAGHIEPGRGTVGGGMPGSGDVGRIDNMMIGKMVGALAGAGFSDSAIRAFMKAKMDEDEEEEEEPDGDEDGEDDDDDGDGMPPAYAKSSSHDFRKSFAQDPDIAEAVDAAPFMEALTARTTEALGKIAKSMGRSQSKQDKMKDRKSVV